MLTDDTKICSVEFWNDVYSGARKNTKTDSSNFKRAPNSFDRFQWIADQIEGPVVLDVASGHATTMKRLKAMHPNWNIVCSDQTQEARKAAKWDGSYHIVSAYELPMLAAPIDTVCISQALEYLEFPDKFMERIKYLMPRYFVCTVPEGNMEKWSQLRIYTEETLKNWLSGYGQIIHFDKVPGLMLAKLKLEW